MDYLNLKQIEARCPSALTQNHANHLSHIYKFIPTTEVVSILGKEGWLPTQALQVNSRKGYESESLYKKHILRFRNPTHENISKKIGDTFPEIVMTNSHDGSSSFQFHAGLFRLVCSNGLVIADKTFNKLKITHKGFDQEQVMKVIKITTDRIPLVVGNVQKMMDKSLTHAQQHEFAKIASFKRWGEDKIIDSNQLIKINRREDKGNDLWTVFNRVQENMLKGGTIIITPKEKGKTKSNRSRSITSINQNLNTNKMLWELSENFL